MRSGLAASTLTDNYINKRQFEWAHYTTEVYVEVDGKPVTEASKLYTVSEV